MKLMGVYKKRLSKAELAEWVCIPDECNDNYIISKLFSIPNGQT